MEFKLLYWHWLVIGMLLVIAEIFMPSFTIFWFGLGAMVVALMLLLLPGTTLTWQLLLWAVASGILTVLWFKIAKPRMVDRTTAGVAREALLGEAGQVIKTPQGGQRGIVRFTTPILGNDEWPFICEHPTLEGDRVFIKEISGNTLIVEKRSA